MKVEIDPDQELSTSCTSINSSLKSPSKGVFQNLRILCPNGFKGEEYCTDCNKYAVICDRRQCQCYKAHSRCEYFQKIEQFHKSLDSKLHQKPDFQNFSGITDMMIDSISDLDKQIQKQFKYFGLTLAEKKIAEAISSISQGQHTSTNQFKTYRYSREVKENWIQTSTGSIKSLIEYTREKLNIFFAALQYKIDQQHKQCMQKYDISQIQSLIINNNNNELKILDKFLNQNRTVVNIKKLYANVSNEVDMQDVFDICHQKSDLLFFIQNTEGKKFGAFIKCEFDKLNDNWKSDDDEQSFMFSINMNSKHKLDKKMTFKASIQILTRKQCLDFGPLRTNHQNKIGIAITFNYRQHIYNAFMYNGENIFKELNGAKPEAQCFLKNLEIYQIIDKEIREKPTLFSNPKNIIDSIQPQQNSCIIPPKQSEIFNQGSEKSFDLLALPKQALNTFSNLGQSLFGEKITAQQSDEQTQNFPKQNENGLFEKNEPSQKK